VGARGRLVGALSTKRPFADRLPRRRREAAWFGAVVAPLLLTRGSRSLGSSVPPVSLLFGLLLVVVVVALVGGARAAITAVVASLLAQEVFFGFPYGSLSDHKPAQLSVLVVFVVVGAGIGILVDELARLTTEQAALRRIATLVARGVPPAALLSAVADEVAALLGADGAVVGHLGPDGLLTLLAVEGHAGEFVAGESVQIEPGMASAMVVRTGQPARTDGYEQTSAELSERIRRAGIRSSVATPIVVDGQLWGVIVASSRRTLPADAERRMLNFTEVVATAIANAESRSELAASRLRIVAAADATRRRIERDLHDGVQQRLVTLALEIRTIQSALSPRFDAVQPELSRVVDGLTDALDELREISHGIHPAILSEGGLGPALRTLARRAPVAVVLDVQIEDEPPDVVEVAAYYAVSELLTNTAKHAHASTVSIAVTSADGALRIAVRDDGVGGADPVLGSGLVGLRDRIEALGGTISLRSPKGEGTTIEVALPFGGDSRATDDQHDPPLAHGASTTSGILFL
jgi:signal transduction histidine kinase